MTIAVLASPAPPLPDPSGHPGWNYIESTWTDWTGRVWDLTDPESGLFLMRGGVRGLGHTQIEHKRDRSPAVYGSYWRGVDYPSREVFWPLHLFSDESSLDYVTRDRAWWRGLHPKRRGTWAVRVPDTGTRYLDLRLEGDGQWAPELDPTFYGWATYGITLQADRPLWRGEPVHREFKSGVETNFFDGPNRTISPGSTLASASVQNPGDETAFGIIKAHGPFASLSFAIGSGVITLPVTRAAGKTVTFDTNPTANTVIDSDGVDLFSSLTAYSPAAIEPFDEVGAVPIGITATGSTSATKIEVDFEPLYHRAW